MLFKSKEYELKIYDGYQFWCELATYQYHRLNGPASIYPSGYRQWCKNGKLHRLDGPAVIFPDGSTQWWKNDNIVIGIK